jgi:hypothetical protein
VVGNSLALNGSIVAANAGAFGPELNVEASLNVVHSLIGDKSGTSLIEAPVGSPDARENLIGGPIHGAIDPKLGPLAYNGGPTFRDGSKLLTRALLPGSPAIDMGDPTAASGFGNVPLFDQRGQPFARKNGARIDIGAFEWQPNPLTGDYNFDGEVDAGDFALWRNTRNSKIDFRADGNGDGIVDDADRDIWRASFGRTLRVEALTGFDPGDVSTNDLLADALKSKLPSGEENNRIESIDEVFESIGSKYECGTSV